MYKPKVDAGEQGWRCSPPPDILRDPPGRISQLISNKSHLHLLQKPIQILPQCEHAEPNVRSEAEHETSEYN